MDDNNGGRLAAGCKENKTVRMRNTGYPSLPYELMSCTIYGNDGFLQIVFTRVSWLKWTWTK